MTIVRVKSDELEELEMKEFMGHIIIMSEEDRKAAMEDLPTAELEILSDLALAYEAYEVCSTARDVLAGYYMPA